MKHRASNRRLLFYYFSSPYFTINMEKNSISICFHIIILYTIVLPVRERAGSSPSRVKKSGKTGCPAARGGGLNEWGDDIVF